MNYLWGVMLFTLFVFGVDSGSDSCLGDGALLIGLTFDGKKLDPVACSTIKNCTKFLCQIYARPNITSVAVVPFGFGSWKSSEENKFISSNIHKSCMHDGATLVGFSNGKIINITHCKKEKNCVEDICKIYAMPDVAYVSVQPL